MAKIDRNNRAVRCEILPDLRLRVTDTLDILDFEAKSQAKLIADLQLAWGTAHDQYPSCLLIRQDEMGQNNNPAKQPNDPPPQLVRIYEQIPVSAEVQVGNNEVIQLKDGRVGIKAEFLQFSSATATPGTINVTTAPGVATAFMLGEDAPNDGTLRRITRTYETAGTISQTDETKNNGALLLRTIVSVHTAPATPSGYTLIFTKQDEINGFPTDTYTFAKGTGEIDRSIEYSQSSDQGATGVTRTTIRYLVVPGATVQPTTLAGSVLIGTDVVEQDGTRLWTTTWAKGTGTVSTTNETKNNGALLIRTIIALGGAPATPGGYTIFSTQVREEAGYEIFTYGFAQGTGQIDLNIEYEISPDYGATGITRQTIKYISTPSTVVNPITTPVGYVLISQDRLDSDGFAIWTATYVFGVGTISSEIEIKENGNLYIYTKTAINAVPSTPSPTIGGTVILVHDDVRNGTRVENGCLLYTRVWAEGNGTIATHIITKQDGLREVTIISIGTRVVPTGILIRDDVQTESGYNLYTLSAMQTAAGGAGVTGVTFTFGSIEKWTYPGRLKPFVAITGAFKALDVYKSPPITTDIAASIQISYQTSGTLTLSNTLWSPTDAAAMYSQWVGTNGQQHNLVESYPGYRYVSGGTSNLTSTDNVHFSIFNQPIIAGNNATISATGGPVSPDGNTYCLRAHLEPAFTDTSGTIYYRKTEVFATIPTQTALPV